jgi:hypothetical protein
MQHLPITYNKAQAVNSNYYRGEFSFLQVKDLNYRDKRSFCTTLPTSFTLWQLPNAGKAQAGYLGKP